MTAPLAAYNFDEASGDVIDCSGNGRNFALTSPNVRVTGHTGSGLSQSGADLLIVSSTILNALKTSNRTVMGWVKETTPITGWAFEFYNSTIDSGTWGLLFLSSQWHIQARNASGFVRASVARPTDSAFHHVAGTYDGTNVKLYLDATLVATQPLTAPLRTDADVFRFFENTSSSVTVDDVRFFDAALTPSEIATFMSTPVIAGRSGKPKVWNGSTWSQHQAKVWNGSTWVNARMNGHNGTEWITAK